jgi:hypothetical protein
MDTRCPGSRRGTANRARFASHDWVGVPPSVYRREKRGPPRPDPIDYL